MAAATPPPSRQEVAAIIRLEAEPALRNLRITPGLPRSVSIDSVGNRGFERQLVHVCKLGVENRRAFCSG